MSHRTWVQPCPVLRGETQKLPVYCAMSACTFEALGGLNIWPAGAALSIHSFILSCFFVRFCKHMAACVCMLGAYLQWGGCPYSCMLALLRATTACSRTCKILLRSLEDAALEAHGCLLMEIRNAWSSVYSECSEHCNIGSKAFWCLSVELCAWPYRITAGMTNFKQASLVSVLQNCCNINSTDSFG